MTRTVNPYIAPATSDTANKPAIPQSRQMLAGYAVIYSLAGYCLMWVVQFVMFFFVPERLQTKAFISTVEVVLALFIVTFVVASVLALVLGNRPLRILALLGACLHAELLYRLSANLIRLLAA